MKKFVLKLNLYDDKEKRKAFKIVSALSGIDSVSMDMEDKKLTVIGTVDPVIVVTKLRKFWPTDILYVGPAEEPEKKEEVKKEEPKKEEVGKKDEPNAEEKREGGESKSEELKKEEEKVKETKSMTEIMPYRPYYRPMNTYYHVHHSMEEDPNSCVIC